MHTGGLSSLGERGALGARVEIRTSTPVSASMRQPRRCNRQWRPQRRDRGYENWKNPAKEMTTCFEEIGLARIRIAPVSKTTSLIVSVVFAMKNSSAMKRPRLPYSVIANILYPDMSRNKCTDDEGGPRLLYMHHTFGSSRK